MIGPPLAGVYAATKGAIESFSDSLRREVSHFGISVSIIEPCYVATNLLSFASSEAHTAIRTTTTTTIPLLNSDSSNKDNGNNNNYRELYAPLYSKQVEEVIKFCVQRASSPTVTSDAIEVISLSLTQTLSLLLLFKLN